MYMRCQRAGKRKNKLGETEYGMVTNELVLRGSDADMLLSCWE